MKSHEQMTPSAPLDLEALLSRVMHDRKVMHEVLRAFEQDLNRELGLLRRSRAATPDLSRLAHHIKGAALTVSAHDLAEAACQLEFSKERKCEEALGCVLSKGDQVLEYIRSLKLEALP